MIVKTIACSCVKVYPLKGWQKEEIQITLASNDVTTITVGGLLSHVHHHYFMHICSDETPTRLFYSTPVDSDKNCPTVVLWKATLRRDTNCLGSWQIVAHPLLTCQMTLCCWRDQLSWGNYMCGTHRHTENDIAALFVSQQIRNRTSCWILMKLNHAKDPQSLTAWNIATSPNSKAFLVVFATKTWELILKYHTQFPVLSLWTSKPMPVNAMQR